MVETSEEEEEEEDSCDEEFIKILAPEISKGMRNREL